MKLHLLPLAALLAVMNIGCASPRVAENAGRRYFHSPLPHLSKMGVTYEEPRTVDRTPARERRYHHSPVPHLSKMGVTHDYVR